MYFFKKKLKKYNYIKEEIMKKVLIAFLIFLTFFLLLFLSCNLNFLNAKEITKIYISDSENSFEITDKSDIRYFISFFKTVKPFNGNPSCPFEYLVIVFIHKNGNKYIFNYASDLCPIFKYKNIPYTIDDSSNNNLRRFLREKGIRDHIW